MERHKLPQQEQSALERLRQPFAIYQFVDKRVVTLVLSDGFCKLFGYDDRAQAYYDMDNNMYKDTVKKLITAPMIADSISVIFFIRCSPFT